MYIERIILDGFKSYSSRTEVGPFDPQFTAITGFNGSGKSNILDSICFVLGITNLTQVRVNNLQELVYKQGQAGITKASVQIIFNNEDKKNAPIGYEQHDKITVCRQIIIGGRNRYMINSHNVQQQQVQNLFHSVQLNVNNPHFLIMQGRITKVINMKPPEILGMIEEAAGTRMYETKKLNAQKLMDKKQAKVDEIQRILAEDITPTLEKLGQERTNYRRWASMTHEIERQGRWVYAYEYDSWSQKFEAGEAELQKMQASVQRLQDEVLEQGHCVTQLEEREKVLVAQRDQAKSGKLRQLEDHESELTKELAKTDSKLQHKEKSLAAEIKVAREAEKSIGEAQKQKQKQQHALDDALKKQEEFTKAKTQVEGDLDKAERTLAALNAGMEEEGQDSLQGQLMQAQQHQSEVDGEGKRLQIELKTYSTNLKAQQSAFSKLQSQGKQQEQALVQRTAQLEKAIKDRDQLGFDHRKFGSAEVKFKQERDKLEQLKFFVRELEVQLSRVNFEFNAPNGFKQNKVKGVVARLFELKGPFRQYATAVEVAAGGRLFFVVVDNEQTGKVVINSGLKRKVTIVPLNKIDDRTCKPAQVQAAKDIASQMGGEVQHALEVVGYEHEVAAAMKFVFGNTLVCDSAETARMVTFHPNVRVRTVTKLGDVYDPSGTLTGGSSTGGHGKLIQQLDELREATEKLQKGEKAFAGVQQEWAEQCKLQAEHQRRCEKVDLAEHEHKLVLERQANTEFGSLERQIKDLQQGVQERETSLSTLDARRATAKKKVQELEKQIANFAVSRTNRVQAAEKEITKLRKQAKDLEKEGKATNGAVDQLQLQVGSADEEMQNLQEALQSAKKSVEECQNNLQKSTEEAESLKQQLEEAKDKLKKAKAELASADSELKNVAKEIKDRQDKRDEAQRESKTLEHKVKSFHQEQQEARSAVQKMEQEAPWILQEKAFFGKAGTDFDFKAQDYSEQKQKLDDLKAEQKALSQKVNKKAIGMYEKAEEEHTELLEKRNIVLKDKDKIDDVIKDLDKKKKEALEKTWEKVSNDFGSIFGTLLPNVNAKLEPAGKTCLDGLEIKVAFQGVWKQSLTELSGGQKSLLALSLVLSLLLFKPAPMYILDEIDAALDLSHTQNIGTMIRTHFPHSQFVIVSLKEGMFQNASVLFQTRFVDGCSQVARFSQEGKAKALGNGVKGALEDSKENEGNTARPKKRAKKAT